MTGLFIGLFYTVSSYALAAPAASESSLMTVWVSVMQRPGPEPPPLSSPPPPAWRDKVLRRGEGDHGQEKQLNAFYARRHGVGAWLGVLP